MHEFSLAQNVVEIVEEAVTSHNASRATLVVIEIGKLSGVEIEAFKTAMEALQPGTLMEGAEIDYDIKEGLAKCQKCGSSFSANNLFTPCPDCGTYHSDIVQGKELLVKSLTAE